ncbi:inducible T-cell costimulator [Ambystoma mexicanum]|uniref:inducible T-cell costimulator n=1 Tax=Ambystoma mexicanum TaxID=8296 RepID=UPI0037E82520
MAFLLLATVQLASAHIAIDSPPVVVAFHNGQAELTCKDVVLPNITEEFKLTLLKGNQTGPAVCAGYWGPNKNFNYPSLDQAQCVARRSANGLSFSLANLDTSHTDYYFCRLEILFPPPYDNLILGKTYLYVHNTELQNCECKMYLLPWSAIGLGVALLLCPLLVVAFCLYKRPGKCAPAAHEPNSEYMPMAAVTAARNKSSMTRTNVPNCLPEAVGANSKGVPGTHKYNNNF